MMYEEQVKAILDNVKKRGDEALFEYTENSTASVLISSLFCKRRRN